MKIIINASSIHKGGAEQVVHSFINECINYPQHSFHILIRENIRSQLQTDLFPQNFYFYDVQERPGKSFYHIYKSIKEFDDLAEEINPDAVISTGGHGFWKPDIPVVGGFNIPHYLYPESPYFDKISLKRKLYWKLKKVFDLFFYRRLDAIVVQTDDVKDRLRKLIPSKPIYSVSNTVNATFMRDNYGSSPLEKKEEGEFRLLTLSADYPHKNLEIIKDVVEELQNRKLYNVKFVLTLPEEAFEKFEEPGIKDQLLNVKPVPIEKCPALYRDCDAMFLPTLLECFSASYAEAMKMRKPILTSDLGFAHTVCKEAALYFDPLDPVNIANKIEQLINDAELYEELVGEGIKEFQKLKTPAERAESFIKVAESLVSNGEYKKQASELVGYNSQ